MKALIGSPNSPFIIHIYNVYAHTHISLGSVTEFGVTSFLRARPAPHKELAAPRNINPNPIKGLRATESCTEYFTLQGLGASN